MQNYNLIISKVIKNKQTPNLSLIASPINLPTTINVLKLKVWEKLNNYFLKEKLPNAFFISKKKIFTKNQFYK